MHPANQRYYRYVVVPNDRNRKFVQSNPRPVSTYQHFNYDVLFDKNPPEPLATTTEQPSLIAKASNTDTSAMVVAADMPLPARMQPEMVGEAVRRNPDPQIHIVLRRRRKPGKIVFKQFNSVPVRNGIKMLKIKHRNVYKPMASNVRVLTPTHDQMSEQPPRSRPPVPHKVRNRKKVPQRYMNKQKMRRPTANKPSSYKTSSRPEKSRRPSHGRKPPDDEDDYAYDDSSDERPANKPKRKHKQNTPEDFDDSEYSVEDEGDDDDDDESAENMRYKKRTRKPREHRRMPPNHKESPNMKDYTFYITKYDKSDRNVANKPVAVEHDEPDNDTSDDYKHFVPVRMLASVRHREEVYRQPVHRQHPRVRKRVVEKGGHLVYTEDGYEDNSYDHGVQEKHAAHHQMHRSKRDTRGFPVMPFTKMLRADPTYFQRGQRAIRKQTRQLTYQPPRSPPQLSPSMSYYDTKKKRCDDMDFDDTEMVNQNGKHSTKSPKKRLNGLGDKIDCMREKLFGIDPFDNPLFISTYVVWISAD